MCFNRIPEFRQNNKVNYSIHFIRNRRDDLFLRREKARENEFVSPSASSVSDHVVEPRKAQLKLIELSGVPFDIHCLRRSFITIAESLER